MLELDKRWLSLTPTQQNAVALANAHGTPGQVAELLGMIPAGYFVDEKYVSQIGEPVIVHYQ